MKSFLDKALEEQIYWIREKDGTLKPCDVITWAKFFEDTSNRIIKKTQIKVPTAIVSTKPTPDKIVEVSTVFLGMSHGTGPTGKPLIFETMVFVGEESEDIDQQRYETEVEAIRGHEKIERELKAKIDSIIPKPIFMGKDVKIKIDGKEVAYASDVEFSIDDPVSTVETEDPSQKQQREEFQEALKKL